MLLGKKINREKDYITGKKPDEQLVTQALEILVLFLNKINIVYVDHIDYSICLCNLILRLTLIFFFQSIFFTSILVSFYS